VDALYRIRMAQVDLRKQLERAEEALDALSRDLRGEPKRGV